MNRILNFPLVLLLIASLLAGCTTIAPQNNTVSSTETGNVVTDIQLASPTFTVQPTVKPTATSTITPSPAPTSTPSPIICNPGVTIDDPSEDASAPLVDITGISSELQNGTLSVTIQLQDLPDEITVRRDGIKKGYMEYDWGVDIDVDNNQETGFYRYSDPDSIETADYKMMVSHFNNAEGEPKTGPFKETIGGGYGVVMKYTEKGMTQVAVAKYEVDTKGNTITLSGNIPGVSQDSKLIFSAQDYQPGKPSIFDRVCEIPSVPVVISYLEDFEDNIAQDWRFGSGWKINTEDGNHILHGAGPEQYPYAWYSSSVGRVWDDYAYQSKIRFTDGSIFICLRSDSNGFYNVMLSPSDDSTVFADNQNALGYNTFGGASYQFEKDKWYLVRFEAQGDDLRLYIDDELVDEQKRATHSRGNIGYYLDTGAEVDIDDIEVWSIPIQ